MFAGDVSPDLPIANRTQAGQGGVQVAPSVQRGHFLDEPAADHSEEPVVETSVELRTLERREHERGEPERTRHGLRLQRRERSPGDFEDLERALYPLPVGRADAGRGRRVAL